MRYFKTCLTLLALLALTVTGCLVSGTYPIVENVSFSFTADTGFYWAPIDMTSNDDWDEHSDKLDDIDAVGFEFDLENGSDQDCSFSLMVKAETGASTAPDSGEINDYTLIIDNLEVAANSTTHLSYAESLGMIQNQATLKQIILSGRFDCAATSCGGTGASLFHVTNGKVIITVSASD